MSSTQVRPKILGVGTGYFIAVGNNSGSATSAVASKVLVNTGTDSLPSFSTNIYACSGPTSTVVNTGGIMKDLGKTLVSSGRVFRKVQLLISSSTTAGVGGIAAGNTPYAPEYLTGFIELPGAGVGSGAPLGALAAVARLG